MKTNDICVCAFPKSGITYLGFLLLSARLHHNGIALNPTFYNIDWLLIDSHKMQAYEPPAPLWRDGIGEFYKTHEPRGNNAPLNVIYLLRDPVATLSSYFHFRRQLGSPDTVTSFLAGPHGIPAWNAHVRSWLIDNTNVSQSLYVLHYDNLVKQPDAELLALGEVLGFKFSRASLEAGVNGSNRLVMRADERDFAAHNPVYARHHLNFVSPEGGRVVPEFTPEHVQLIENRCGGVYAEACEVKS